ncbi:MAG: ribonuclease HIII [Verrucomicrobiales bacterium]
MPSSPNKPVSKSSHTQALTSEQAVKLQGILREQGFEPRSAPYTIFSGRKGKLQVNIYEKGPKVLVQGPDTEDFVKFTLEPQVLGQATLGYEEVLNPEMFAPHIGIDESGKGDFFGPLVIAAAYTDADTTRSLMQAGIMDSKRIGSDARIASLAKEVRAITQKQFYVVLITPKKYNQLIAKMKNLNRLLAWGHARALESLLELVPECERALSDQFGNPKLIEGMLMERGQEVKLEQRTKAEADIAVAAASILARDVFVDWLKKAGEQLGEEPPKGASSAVIEFGRRLVARHGQQALDDYAKLHFKTTQQVLQMGLL